MTLPALPPVRLSRRAARALAAFCAGWALLAAPVPPAPTVTPVLPTSLPKTRDGPLSNPAAVEWLALALLAVVCGLVGWRGGGVVGS